jgi:hypothetical protein
LFTLLGVGSIPIGFADYLSCLAASFSLVVCAGFAYFWAVVDGAIAVIVDPIAHFDGGSLILLACSPGVIVACLYPVFARQDAACGCWA